MTTTIIDYIRSILGTYTPITYQVWDAVKEEYQVIVAYGLAGVDWGYILTGVLFIVVAYCILKVLGALICKIF